MKTIARIELKPGMIAGEDITDYNGKVLVPTGTEFTESHIAKLARHQIMAVTIKEKIDFATTHFEKVRFSDGFKKFNEDYCCYFNVYKEPIVGFLQYQMPFNIDRLMTVYENITAAAETPELLLDYLYNMTPSEDNMTHAHCLNSALIAGVFGKWLGLSATDQEILIQTGFVYDIGKLRIPDSILWKTGKLDDAEREFLKKHAKMGYDMVKKLPLNVHIPFATLQHHERIDGSGYPDGLKGDAIDPFAKIIAIVDTYEAMTSPRVYRQSLIPFQVIAHYEESRGFERYDRQALTTILTNIARSQIGLPVRLSDGRTAEVESINEDHLSQPVVKLDNGVLLDTAQFGVTIEAIY
ncbi:MAG: HD-GYP domain-containing protein [Lachnospiraceae bacterium]|nr:HD-GYP domain-containing protein [Lachnospiraceae bacterium]